MAGPDTWEVLGLVVLVLRITSVAGWAQAGAVDGTFSISADPRGRVWALAVQPDDKILVAGEFRISAGANWNFVCRLNADGTPDSQFLPELEPYAEARALALQPDGRILVGGDFYDPSKPGQRGVVRLNTNGSRDVTFDSSTAMLDRVRHLQLQPDGAVLASELSRLVRLLNDGRPDTNFPTHPGFPFEIGQVAALAQQADGKILVAGTHRRFNSLEQSGLLRLHPDGSLDTNFVAPLIAGQALLLPDSASILVAGTFTNQDGTWVRRLARLRMDGSIDPTFDSAALQGQVWRMAQQTNGCILLAGSFQTIDGILRDGIARSYPSGALDRSFDAGISSGDVFALAVQADQRLIIGGDFRDVWGVQRTNIARLLYDAPGFAGRLEFGSATNRVSEGAGTVTLPVLRFVGTNGTVTVQITPNPWWIQFGQDYQFVTTNLTFAPGQTSQDLRLAIIDDQELETSSSSDSESFGLMLTNAAGGAVIGSQSTTVLAIVDNDSTVEFTEAVFSRLEAGSNAVVTVRRSGSLYEAVSVHLQTSGGTATAWSDYVPQIATLDFLPGETNKAFTIPLLPDSEVEGDETIGVRLSDPAGGAQLGARSNAVVRIVDDGVGAVDATFVPMRAGSIYRILPLAEGKVLAVGAFGSSVPSNQVGVVRFLADGSVDPSFRAPGYQNGLFRTAALEQDGKILVGGNFLYIGGRAAPGVARLNTDGSLDTNFTVSTASGVKVGGDVYALAVQPDGKILVAGSFGSGQPNIGRLRPNGAMDGGFNPGTGTDGIVYRMVLQPDGRIVIAGGFTQFNGIPRAGLARLNADGSLDPSFNPTVGWSAYWFPPVGDLLLQTDGRMLISGWLTLAPGVSGLDIVRLNSDGLLDGSFQCTNSPGEVYALSLQSDGRVLVGGSGSGRLVRLNPDGSHDRSFATGTAAAPGTITVLAMQADGQVLVGGGFDAFNGIARPGLARLNNDSGLAAGYVEFISANFAVEESVAQINLTARRTGGSNGVVLVTYGTVAVTATAGADFVPLSGTLTFGDGDTADRIITVQVLDDPIAEPDETFLVGLVNPLGGAVLGGRASVRGTILERDMVIQFTPPRQLTDHIVDEDDGQVTVSLSRWGFLGGAVTVAYVTSNGTAQAGSDFCPLQGSLTFGPGQTNVLLSVPIIDDARPEPDETFYVVLTGSTNGALLGSNTLVALTILDNDRPGTLDLSFDPGGGPSLYGTPAGVQTMTLQADGKLLIGGRFTEYDGVPRSCIARVNADGSLDPSFDPGSGATGGDSQVLALAVQPNGKVLLGGSFSQVDGTPRAGLARLNTNGSLGAVFNPQLTHPWRTVVSALALQPDGRVLIGGAFTSVDGLPRNGLARLNADGSLDPSFDAGQGITLGLVPATPQVLSLQADGRLILGGQFDAVNGVNRKGIARLNANGTVDDSFNPGTGVTVSQGFGGSAPGTVYAVLRQPNGNLLIGGRFTHYNGTARGSMARLHPDGSLANGFDPGVSSFYYANNTYVPGTIYVLASDASGRVLLGGDFVRIGSQPGFSVARLRFDGTLDVGFAPSSIRSEESVSSMGDATIRGLAVEQSGSILVGGDIASVGWTTRFGLARLRGADVLEMRGIQPLFNGQMRVLVGVPLPHTYVVEASTDLIQWLPIATNSASGNLLEVIDPEASAFSHRFYRAVAVP